MKEMLQNMIEGATGQVIDKVGYVSIGSGLSFGISGASDGYTFFSIIPQTWPEWGVFFSILGAMSLIIKNGLEIHWKRKDRKKNATND